VRRNRYGFVPGGGTRSSATGASSSSSTSIRAPEASSRARCAVRGARRIGAIRGEGGRRGEAHDVHLDHVSPGLHPPQPALERAAVRLQRGQHGGLVREERRDAARGHPRDEDDEERHFARAYPRPTRSSGSYRAGPPPRYDRYSVTAAPANDAEGASGRSRCRGRAPWRTRATVTCGRKRRRSGS
jgi:hypothetical protein